MKIAGIVFLFFFGMNAIANSGGGEEKKAEPAQAKPWVELQNRVSALATKTKQYEDELHHLIHEKKNASSNEKIRELDHHIDAAYKEFKKSAEEFKKQSQILKYRYPERQAKEADRVYDKKEIPSLNQIEESLGVEGKLRRNMRRMRTQFGTAEQKKKDREESETLAPTPTPANEMKTIREEEAPLLSK